MDKIHPSPPGSGTFAHTSFLPHHEARQRRGQLGEVRTPGPGQVAPPGCFRDLSTRTRARTHSHARARASTCTRMRARTAPTPSEPAQHSALQTLLTAATVALLGMSPPPGTFRGPWALQSLASSVGAPAPPPPQPLHPQVPPPGSLCPRCFQSAASARNGDAKISLPHPPNSLCLVSSLHPAPSEMVPHAHASRS